VDFLLVIIELVSLGVAAEASEYQLEVAIFEVLPKISDRRGRPHRPFFLSKN